MSDLFRLDGKTALVSGAGRGIGLAVAKALARHGAAVTLAARTVEEIETEAERLRAEGLSATALRLDVADIAAVSETILSEGPFEILVNNAGTNRPATFLDVTPEDYDAVTDLNVRSAFFVAQAVAKGLVAAGRAGSIINMSSQMGHVGGRRRTVYCASKHAMEGFTKAMALDLAPHRIRVNSVCPTFIETPMTRPFFADPTFLAETLEKIPLGRLGQVDDVVGAVVYLASDASGLVTGSALKVDGGWTAV